MSQKDRNRTRKEELYKKAATYQVNQMEVEDLIK